MQGTGTRTSTSSYAKGASKSLYTLSTLHSDVPNSRFIFTLEGKEITVSPDSPQPIHIPAHARHTFRVDDTHEGPCTLAVTADAMPSDGSRGMSEKLCVISKFLKLLS